MDSHYNPSYAQWNSPYSPHPSSAILLPPPPPPLPLPPPLRQSHPESPNFYGLSNQSNGQRQDYHHQYSQCQDLLPTPTVNQPSTYYSQHQPPLQQQQHPQYIPQHVSYEPQRISQPLSSSISIAESRVIAQSDWVGFSDKRHDSRTVNAGQGRMDSVRSRVDTGPSRNYEYDYSRSSIDFLGVGINRGLDGSFRSRDEFRSLGYVRKDSGDTRIEGNYQDRGRLKSGSERCFMVLDEGNRGLSQSVGYGSDQYGVTVVNREMNRSSASHEGARNQSWDEAYNGGRTLYPQKKEDYYHSEREQCFGRGRREESNELNQTPRKQMQKKSALLRLETPKSHQKSREKDWSRQHNHRSGKRFNSNLYRGKEHLGHSDRGLVERQRGRASVHLDETSKGKVKPKPADGTSKHRTQETGISVGSGDLEFPCNSLSSSPRLSFKQMRSESHVAARVENTSKFKEKTKQLGGTSKKRSPETNIVAVSGDSLFPCNSLSSIPRLSCRLLQSENHVAAMVNETSKVKESKKEVTLLDTSQEQIITFQKVTQPGSSLVDSPCLGRNSPGTYVIGSYDHPIPECRGSDLGKKPNENPIEKLTDVTVDVCSQEKYSLKNAKTEISGGEALSSDEKVSGTEICGDKGVRVSKATSHADAEFALTHVKDLVVSVPHQDSQSKAPLNSRYETQKKEKKSNNSTQKSYPHSISSMSNTKKDANPPTHITKRHTWQRKSDTSPSPFVAAIPLSSSLSTQQIFSKGTALSSCSYVRKGNSLLRKHSHSSPGVSLGMVPSTIQMNRFTVADKCAGPARMVDVVNTSSLVKTGEILTLERQSKPPLDSSTSKVSNATPTSSGKCALSYSMDHFPTGLPESVMDSATSREANVPHSGGDTFKTSDILIQTSYVSGCQQQRNPPKVDSLNLKRMVYVKRKANQLVAASDIHGASTNQIHPSDGYFKRSKNQLVRNTESDVNQSNSFPDDALNSRSAANMVSERSSSSAFSDSAVMRPFKKSKFSLVWTQNDRQPRMPIAHMRYQKILPQLVPWKRVTYRRKFMNSVSAFRNGSFSNISQKLSMMRKRHTVYTRSINGYSLRKSKVLSVGGSHLKWSKSIERDSRKANEEATLAVAAFSKKESEKRCGKDITRMASRNDLARERIFRFGSLRYKMDSSRRTLQRISDADAPCSRPSENGKGVKRPFIPKRLVIGNEEYVRVGNGNQLVRDPKKRIRVLANEKVRWSLHNVRLRLAKKKKYCQFFTRFGKCNKDDGNCPYVHDPSKIAVCTKFLNGLCSNENCTLTHKVIPERMPDCSYFLQGLCNNEACPYRHVHINPNAAICEGFLKGYCSDGDECRKKHSYTCPVFKATGSCSKGSKCKLQHPKSQSKGRKRKRPSEPSQKNARGRYFSSLHKLLSESEPMAVNRRSPDIEIIGMEGLDIIDLGTTGYEAGDNNDLSTEQFISSNSEAKVSIYNLIRPVALMQ